MPRRRTASSTSIFLAFAVMLASCAEAPAPIAQLCGPSPDVAHATVSTYELRDAITATYTCAPGYVSGGQPSDTQTCVRGNPSWQGDVSCEPSTWIDPDTSLEWETDPPTTDLALSQAIGACTNSSLEGGGWRLPTLHELLTIVDYARFPTVESALDSETDSYWGSDSTPYEAGVGLRFSDGTLRALLKTYAFGYRCVRGAPLPGPAWSTNGDGTATDAETGLTWQAVRTNTESVTLAQANAHCASQTARGGGWRVPTLYEYHFILTFTGSPWFDGSIITDHPAVYFWTSTTRNTTPLVVDFDNMDFVTQGATLAAAVRCVKD